MSYLENVQVSLDSRLVQPGDYFVPVVGKEDDGHKYIDDAMKRGAVGIIEEKELHQLAREKLNDINPAVIAITGSVGKTTMREFISQVLSVKWPVVQGKLNTKLGLATNIINNLTMEAEFFVAETGMDRAGELLETGQFIKPQAAVITNISESHLEKLGSLDEIIKAKSEILRVLPDDGVAFLNWENEHIQEVAHLAPKVVSYGLEKGDYLQKVLPRDLPVIGRHNRLNAVGAFAVGKYFGLSADELRRGLLNLSTPKGRLNKLNGINGAIIFDDTYNASPVSAGYALESVTDYYSKNNLDGRKIAVLGGMLELGEYEDEGHRIVGGRVREFGYDIVVLVGPLARKYEVGLKSQFSNPKYQIYEVANAEEVGQLVKREIKPQSGDAILLKASQGIRLEKAVEQLMADPSLASRLLVRQDARWV